MWSGCWEKRTGRTICRWMVAWFSTGKNIFGAIAGYSGGGCFQLERFSIVGTKISIEAYDDIFFESEGDQTKCEMCIDEILSKHAKEPWETKETLCLIDEDLLMSAPFSDLIVAGNKMPHIFLDLFQNIGLITKPGKESLN